MELPEAAAVAEVLEEVLEETVDEEASGALEEIVDEEALEALVVIVAVVVVAGDSEVVVVVSEAHKISLCTPGATQQFSCSTITAERPQIAGRKKKRLKQLIRSYGLMALTSSSTSLSLPIRSRWVFTVYDIAHGRVRVQTRHNSGNKVERT